MNFLSINAIIHDVPQDIIDQLNDPLLMDFDDMSINKDMVYFCTKSSNINTKRRKIGIIKDIWQTPQDNQVCITICTDKFAADFIKENEFNIKLARDSHNLLYAYIKSARVFNLQIKELSIFITKQEVIINNPSLLKIEKDEQTFYDYYKSMLCISEAQWNMFVKYGYIDKIIENHDEKIFIGKRILINNTNIAPEYNKYTIAGFNHDNTSGTVDLICCNVVATTDFGSSNIYQKSYIRSYINGIYFEGFSDVVKENLVDIEVISNGDVLYDKVKIPSCTELGISEYAHGGYVPGNEGTRYPLFRESDFILPEDCHIIRKGKMDRYWTRSKYDSKDNRTIGWVVTENSRNNIKYEPVSSYNGIVPIIRFKKSE